MSTRSAPAASPIAMPSPVAPTESVERIFSSIAGLYLTRMSTLLPNPPVASTTALHETSVSSPVRTFFTLIPAIASPSLTSSVAWVLLNSAIASISRTRSVSLVVISDPLWVMGMMDRLVLWPPNCMRSCFHETPASKVSHCEESSAPSAITLTRAGSPLRSPPSSISEASASGLSSMPSCASDPVAGRGHLAAGKRGVAAENAHLLEKRHRRPRFRRGDGRRESCAACADDGHIDRCGNGRVGTRRLVAFFPGARLFSQRVERLGDGAYECHARQGGAAYGVHVERLAVDDLLGQRLHGGIAQPGRFAGIERRDAVDRAVFQRYLDGKRPMLAHGRPHGDAVARRVVLPPCGAHPASATAPPMAASAPPAMKFLRETLCMIPLLESTCGRLPTDGRTAADASFARSRAAWAFTLSALSARGNHSSGLNT